MRRGLVVVALTVAACTTGRPPTGGPSRLSNPGVYVPCEGDDMLEVTNTGYQAVDVYAYVGSNGNTVFIATASPGTSSLPLDATSVARRTTYFVAKYNGKDVTSAVRFRRWCTQAGARGDIQRQESGVPAMP